MEARYPGEYPDNNPAAPSMPTTQEGLKIIDNACERTLKQGLEGFVLSMLSEPDAKGGEAVISFNGPIGNIENGLGKVLSLLLSRPATKHMTTMAIIAA